MSPGHRNVGLSPLNGRQYFWSMVEMRATLGIFFLFTIITKRATTDY